MREIVATASMPKSSPNAVPSRPVRPNASVCELPVLAPGVGNGGAILVRMSDKIKRIQQLLSRPGLVKDESLEDTFGDLGVYAFLFMIHLKRARKTGGKKTS